MNKLTLHMVRPFNGIANLNRDDLGNPKTMVIGGKNRTVFSPQFFTYHMRRSLFGDGGIGTVRTRYQYRHYVYEPLVQAGVPEHMAMEVMASVDDVTMGRNKKKIEQRFKARDQKAQLEEAELKLAQAVEKGKEEKMIKKLEASVKDLQKAIDKIENDDGDEEASDDPSKRRTAEVQVLEEGRAALLTELAMAVSKDERFKDIETKDVYNLVQEIYKAKFAKRVAVVPATLGSLFGIKSVGDFQPDRDGVIYRSFGISCVEQSIEEDYWIASDDLEARYGRGGGTGAGHVNTTRYAASDVFYLCVTIDLDGAAKMLGTTISDPIISTFVADVTAFIINGPLGAKKTSTNPDANPSVCVLAELHDDPGVYLFPYETSPKGEEPSKWLMTQLYEKMLHNNKQLDRDTKWAAFTLIENVFPQSLTKKQLLAWLKDQISGKVAHPSNGTTTAQARR